MKIKDIQCEAEEFLSLISSWAEGVAPSSIEQDLALAKLMRLYESIKFSEVHVSENDTIDVAVHVADVVEEVAEVAAPITAEVHVPASNIEVDVPINDNDPLFAIDMDAVSLVESAEGEEIAVEEEEVVVESEPEFAAEPEPESAIEPEPEPEAESEPRNDNMLFDIDVVPKQNRHRRSVLMSLYDDDSQPQEVVKAVEAVEEPAEKRAVEPVEEVKHAPTHMSIGSFTTPVQTVGDSLVVDIETVADRLSNSAPRQTLSDRHVYRSFDELGINERYLLARDLFGDDPQLCREMLAIISAFDNYDDAMIYIAENFKWNPDSDGAKLILSILEHKFNIC